MAIVLITVFMDTISSGMSDLCNSIVAWDCKLRATRVFILHEFVDNCTRAIITAQHDITFNRNVHMVHPGEDNLPLLQNHCIMSQVISAHMACRKCQDRLIIGLYLMFIPGSTLCWHPHQAKKYLVIILSVSQTYFCLSASIDHALWNFTLIMA